MVDITLNNSNIPFLLNGTGSLQVAANVPDLTQPIPPSNDNLAQLTFSGSGSQSFTIGAADSVKLGIDASASVQLVPIWSTSSSANIALLQPYNLQNYFDPTENHATNMLLLFLCGGKFDDNVDAKFQYTTLSAEVTLAAGADASYALLVACDKSKPAGDAIADFFKELKLPQNIDGPLQPDEMIAFGYGGYLNLGATLGVGYQLSGGQSFNVGTLDANETYDFSLGGKVTLGAGISGRFNVTVYGGANGWAHVVVHKGRQSNITIAADVNAAVQFSENGLPGSSQDFISAVLGIKSKNWINLFNQAIKWTDFATLQQNLDDLAQTYISEYIGKAFTALQDNAEFSALMAKFQQVVNSYNNAGNDAVTLFDRYYNVATSAIDSQLTDAVSAIKAATSWDDLKSKLNSDAGGVLWEVVNQITKGDPLGWILGQISICGTPVSLGLLQTEVDKVTSLIENDANAEILKVIALAKSEFPLDKFLTKLNGINLQTLQTLADQKTIGFVERIIGQTIKGLNGSDLQKALDKLNSALTDIQNFINTAYSKFQEALNQTYQFQLHAGYSRTAVNDVLIDIELNLNTPEGVALMNGRRR